MSDQDFREAKKEIYSSFEDRCSSLLDEFLTRKAEAVCSKCPEDCGDGSKIYKALGNLVDSLTIKAVERCQNKLDALMCLAMPHLVSARLLGDCGKGKVIKAMAKELERCGDRLVEIATREEGKE